VLLGNIIGTNCTRRAQLGFSGVITNFYSRMNPCRCVAKARNSLGSNSIKMCT
jgi:hypothetical protein